ncbi:MAG: Cys-tRNA(Pro) deacylase [Ignavibacteria bacterium]|jgi:Cys-tRNA(Pro)/Cys-tRNA(Cys) deacylase|nr:Cys-tRNA(Pro) deacylase [Ignavibacteria bacterium]MCU7503450.1 Cys-tRNA(Pro) deacylase [Ignavibacteria bacterium]MCU7516218.1 Cys-tRNA(Pro) deacylase [Ignavibacteria bacterium]
MSKTNAIRILESHGIKHSTVSYDYNEDELDAITVAEKIGAEHEAVFKTLVTRGDKTGINVFCIPAVAELNLKKAALASGNKSIEMIKVKELLPLTGYIRGGCSPIGMKKSYPTYIDETAEIFEEIYVSAGVRGTQVKINPGDLKKVTGAAFADVT